MGQAKRRGSFEQRKAMSINKANAKQAERLLAEVNRRASLTEAERLIEDCEREDVRVKHQRQQNVFRMLANEGVFAYQMG